jgi:osmotically-inducible protein OsmY
MKIRRILTALALLFALTTVALGAGKQSVTDDFIVDSVRQKLAGDTTVKGGAVEVDVKDGVVTLRGHVQEQRQKTKAEGLAKKVKGVKSVVNNIQIVPQ